MSITDELRVYTEKQIQWLDMTKVHYRELFRIADRIDAEVIDMQAFYERLREAAAGREDVTLFGVDYVALPLDADGEPIHVGDVMEFSEFEIEHPVTRTVEGIGQGTFFAWCGERGYQQHEPKRYRHHRPPTVEGILREFAEKMAENTAMYVAESWDADERDEADAAAVAEYAKRLRLAGEE